MQFLLNDLLRIIRDLVDVVPAFTLNLIHQMNLKWRLFTLSPTTFGLDEDEPLYIVLFLHLLLHLCVATTRFVTRGPRGPFLHEASIVIVLWVLITLSISPQYVDTTYEFGFCVALSFVLPLGLEGDNYLENRRGQAEENGLHGYNDVEGLRSTMMSFLRRASFCVYYPFLIWATWMPLSPTRYFSGLVLAFASLWLHCYLHSHNQTLEDLTRKMNELTIC